MPAPKPIHGFPVPGAQTRFDVPQLATYASDTARQFVEAALYPLCEVGVWIGHPHPQRGNVAVDYCQLLMDVALR